jgi:hypothetical protein
MNPPEEVLSSDPRDARSSRGDEAGSEYRGSGVPPLPPADEPPGLPGFRTWRGVYAFVLGVFVWWIALLALLTEKFS